MKKKYMLIGLLIGSIVIIFLNYMPIALMIGGIIAGFIAGIATKRGAKTGASIGAGIGFLSGIIGLSISYMLLSIGGCDQLYGLSIPHFPGSVEVAWILEILAGAALLSGILALFPSALGGAITGYMGGKVNKGENMKTKSNEMNKNKK